MTKTRFHHWVKVLLLIAVVVMGFKLFLQESFAQLAVPNKDVLQGSGIEVDRDFGETVLLMVNYFIGFLGFLATIMFVYAGVLWVLNGGKEEMITKAKKIMTYAALGIVVVILSFSIVRFITESGGKTIAGYECHNVWDCEDGEWCVLDPSDNKYRCSADVRDVFRAECLLTEACPDNKVCVGGTCKSSADIDQKDFECLYATDCDF